MSEATGRVGVPARGARSLRTRGLARRLLADPAALACLVPVVVLAVLGWRLRWVNEDGFIYLRIVDNLLAGHGPVFNPGERIEAYTGPAWLALLTLAGALLPFAALEHVAVVLGLALAVGGLLGATRGALMLVGAADRGPEGATRRVFGAQRGRGLVLPLGAVVVAALPPFWDFATAGLETGLVLGWLGGTFWALAHRAAAEGSGRAWPLAVAIGLGPLVRPDLAVFAAGFLGALLVVARPLGVRRAAGLVAAAAVVPVGYQTFRMGYFAMLVPNTAVAKEAGLAYWSRGSAYLANTVLPYALWLPLSLLLGLGVAAGRRAWSAGARGATVVLAVPVACALVHAVYVVRLGGDYMHARMLLPSIFGLLLPVATVRVPRARWGVASALAVVVWAVVCAVALRAPSSRGDAENRPYLDQRRLQLTAPGHPHPVTLADHGVLPFSQPRIGVALGDLARRGRRVLVTDYVERSMVLSGDRPVRVLDPVPDPRLRPRADLAQGVVVFTGSIGRMGYAAGPDVRFVDRFGLADPIAGRLRLPEPRKGRAGHEKQLAPSWFYGRFADPASIPAGAPQARPAAEARAALACPPLRELLQAVTAPLTAGRFVDNIGVAFRHRSLRVAADPRVARRELC